MRNRLDWYKDAIIYELHVRSFHDSVGDGTGDFRGLTQKLDYLQDLGVTALWLLPFYPSPLRDDGYDIADYSDIHPDYGTLDAFREFLEAAHQRSLRVITEMVINHTSDQHVWFQRARRAPAGSTERDFYVWNDSPEKYRDARIIFKDFESSNWSYDNVAQAYFWHRFYSHQPDLNYDNPAVWQVIFPIVDYWFEMGIDGLRLDAVPYLFEREGTNCENLPETHAFLKALRKHIDERFPDRMLLAEANQWPEDAAAYFGDGDECHMAFHFPVMPRLYMSMHTEDRFPLVDIVQQTPVIPDSCQWAIFLRNHDELTLEMVTDEERDYMYRAYAQERRARINQGIRRRLAPLMGNNRRRIELLNGLLFSLPGTPVVYYGDEIGMGDNIYLGDRNAVRTPMQWSADRNAGFSRANPQRLFLPIIIDPEYHYEAINVEAQQGNPSSLLWWHKRLISLRKDHTAFSRGDIQFLDPHNRKILAFTRKYESDCVLVVANLSRFVQYVELDLSEFEGQRPVEAFGGAPFPDIGKSPYLLTLGPHAFYWFALGQGQMADRCSVTPQLDVVQTWEEIFTRAHMPRLQQLLRSYFECEGPKPVSCRSIRILDEFRLEQNGQAQWVVLATVERGDKESEILMLPLAFATTEEQALWTAGRQPALIARVEGPTPGVIFNATTDAQLCRTAIEAIARFSSVRGQFGELVGRSFVKDELTSDVIASSSVTAARSEQNNQSVVLGDRWVLKLFRRVEEGLHPEVEMARALATSIDRSAKQKNASAPEDASQRVDVPLIPQLLGCLEYRRRRADPIVLGVLHQTIHHESDAWQYALDVASDFFERMAAQSFEAPPLPADLLLSDAFIWPGETETWVEDYLAKAKRLGERLAELHVTLATSDAQDFVPEPFSMQYQRSMYQSVRRQTLDLVDALEGSISQLPAAQQQLAREVVQQPTRLFGLFRMLLTESFGGRRIRVHGDCHLNQVLFTGKDFVFIDFEGVATQSLGERRLKRSPLRDVVGILRSVTYAAHSALLGLSSGRGQVLGSVRDTDRVALTPWADLWAHAVNATLLKSYLAYPGIASLLPSSVEQIAQLLRITIRERLVVETLQELQDRPDWLPIPLTELCRELRL